MNAFNILFSYFIYIYSVFIQLEIRFDQFSVWRHEPAGHYSLFATRYRSSRYHAFIVYYIYIYIHTHTTPHYIYTHAHIHNNNVCVFFSAGPALLCHKSASLALVLTFVTLLQFAAQVTATQYRKFESVCLDCFLFSFISLLINSHQYCYHYSKLH